MLAVLFTGCSKVETPTVIGKWDAVVLNKAGEEVAFGLEITDDGGKLSGVLVNGDERVPSSSGSFDGRRLQLVFDYYDGELNAQLRGDELTGQFTRQLRKNLLSRTLRARRSNPVKGDAQSASAEPGGDINGEWVLRVGEGENERIWRAIFRQKGSEIVGTIIPLSGDWGILTGKIERGRLSLSKFDGINAYLFKAELTPEGRLEGLINSERKAVAYKSGSDAGAAQTRLPDPNQYMRMKNPTEPLRFSFQDADRKQVSLSDDRFKGKVVIITIGGSWCPNCHEEAVVLNDFYDRYRDQGLEIISLNYEYTGDVERDIEQLKIFIRRHNVEYPVLLAGTTDEGEIERTLPQLVNFGGYPSTIFVGRDGLVKRIHTGFEGPATGERHVRLKRELDELVRELLAEQEK